MGEDLRSEASRVFCENLVRYRKRAGLTQKEIADMLGINRTTYTKYETGVCEPSLGTIDQITRIFHTDINTLFYEGRQSVIADLTMLLSESESSMMLDIRRMPEADRERLAQEIRECLRQKSDAPKKEP